MDLKEKLRNLAKEKIRRTQNAKKSYGIQNKKSCVTRAKTHVASQLEKPVQNKDNFFEPEPSGYFGYSRPFEARYPTNKLREITQEFQKKVVESAHDKQLNKKKNIRPVHTTHK